jgi:hypothetical protein
VESAPVSHNIDRDLLDKKKGVEEYGENFFSFFHPSFDRT